MILKKIKNFFDTQQLKKKSQTEARSVSDFLPSNASNLGLVAKILIANFDGQGGERAAKSIAKIFTGESEILALPLNVAVKQPAQLKPAEQVAATSSIIQGLLKAHNGALLVWGEMEDMGTAMKIRFSSPKEYEETARFFAIDEPLEIPYASSHELDSVVLLAIFSELVTSYRGPRRQIANLLSHNLKTTKKFLNLPPTDFSLNQTVSVLNCLGKAAMVSWSLGKKKDIILSEQAFEIALAMVDKKTSPIMWAKIRDNQATLFETQGRLGKDAVKFRHAILAYQEVAGTLGRKVRPHEWCVAWARAALVLYRLGSLERENREHYLKKAADAFEDALTVCDRDVYPARWAEMMNQYGIVLMVLGEYIMNNTTLEKSVKCFREALTIRTRIAVPLLWAETANNLGAAGFALYKRVNKQELLSEASKCFEGAVEVFSQATGHQTRVSVINKNLYRVRELLLNEKARKIKSI